jgi:hypothetical protein
MEREPESVGRQRAANLVLVVGALGAAVAATRGLALGVPWANFWVFGMVVVLPAAVALVLALVLRRGAAATRTNVALLTVATVVGLYAAELVIVLVPKRSPLTRIQRAAAEGRAFDTRLRAEIISDLRAGGTAAYMTLPSNRLRADAERGDIEIRVDGRRLVPLSNVSNRTVVHCNETGETSVFRTDEFGYNNPNGAWSGPLDVALLGDSFVQGACVGPSQTIAAQLRRHLPRTVALALDDFGPLSMLGALREYLPQVRPRDVFWVYYEWNDLRDLTIERRSATLRAYLETDRIQGLAENQTVIDSVLADYIDRYVADEAGRASPVARRGAGRGPSITRSVASWLKLYSVRELLGLADMSDRIGECCDIDTFAAILARARESVESWGGQLHFVYLPAALRYYQPASVLLDHAMRNRRRVLGVVRDLDLPIVDLHRAFRESANPAGLFVDERSHLTADGYRAVADAVIRHLEQYPRMPDGVRQPGRPITRPTPAPRAVAATAPARDESPDVRVPPALQDANGVGALEHFRLGHHHRIQ